MFNQYYLRAQPGTCLAAWMALDHCDEANGCLRVVPGSQSWPLLCTVKADTTKSFTDVTVPIPDDAEIVPIIMDPGDVLFFNSQVVHGSLPNSTEDRFRRALIAHYVQGDARRVSSFYHPAVRMDGTTLDLEDSPGGGRCGVWVEQDGMPVIEMSGEQGQPLKVSE